MVDEVLFRLKLEILFLFLEESDVEDGFVKLLMLDIVFKSLEIYEKGVLSEFEDEGKVEVDIIGVLLIDSDKELLKFKKREILKFDKDRLEE